MNTQNNSSSENLASSQHETHKETTRITTKITLSTELYEEIHSHLSDLSAQLGFKVTLPSFLEKTIADQWRIQLEYYRKLEKGLKRIRL